MKIYTRKGDAGTTGMLGGVRVPKHDPRVDAYGAVDELNSHLGLALALRQGDVFSAERGVIPDLRAERIGELEEWIDELDRSLPPLDAFLLPGGSPVGAQLQVARTVCRRAERAISSLLEDQPRLGDVVLPYMNRLSDLLFVLARAANREAGVEDPEWRPRS
jgi:cob(I)alamin adenosyltransferase